MNIIKFNLFLLIGIVYFFSAISSQAQQGTGEIVLTGTGTYLQDFDSLANTGTSSVLPFGWYFVETGSNANTTYTAGTGSSNTGDTYSFGASLSNERAFGGLQSSSLVPLIGAKLYNNTGYTITQLPIQYYGEMWRLGTSGRDDRLDFQYSLNATALNDINATWVDVDNLDFVTPDNSGTAGPRDGNNNQYRTLISYIITGLNVPNGSSFWIRWVDYNASGADDGLAIDDFSIDETNLPVSLTRFNVFINFPDIKLVWSTATETNNYGWEIERALIDNKTNKPSVWQVIGFVKGSGNSNSPKEYSFVDNNVLYGQYAYRLKQIDIDGGYSYSEEVRVFAGEKPQVYDVKAYPNPFNPQTTIRFELPEAGKVKLEVYDITGQLVTTLVDEWMEAGVYERQFDGSRLASGIYISVMQANGQRIVRKMQLIK